MSDTAAKPDQYDFWRRSIAGEKLPIYDGDVQAGFYRLANAVKIEGKGWKKDGTFSPIAYWWGAPGVDGKPVLRCRVNDTDVDEEIARARWPWASQAPITHELYKAVMAGEPWPDAPMVKAAPEPAKAEVGHNEPPPEADTHETIKEQMANLLRSAQKLIKAGEAKDQETADSASLLAVALVDLQKKADQMRKAEKKPHDDGAAAVQAKWKPMIEAAEIYLSVKRMVIGPYLKRLDDQKQAAELVAEKAMMAAMQTGDSLALEQAILETPAPVDVAAGKGGRRATGLVTIKIVTITDRAEVLKFFAHREEITTLLQSMAEKAVKAGGKIPGITVTEDKEAR